MREGDEDARQKLIEHNMRLIVHVARKYKIPGCTFDDLISIGSIGLIKAVRSYDMDTGTSLSTYAARCIENEILMSLRQSRKQQGDVSLDEPLEMCIRDRVTVAEEGATTAFRMSPAKGAEWSAMVLTIITPATLRSLVTGWDLSLIHL